MEQPLAPLLTLPAADLPPALTEWLTAQRDGPLLVSIEQLGDGRWVLQALPEVDPEFVARVRRTIGQYDDVLRRLT